MAEPKHAPWPWKKWRYKRSLHVVDVHGNFVALVRPVHRFGIAGTDEGHADLLAAAPELADLLRQYRNECSGTPRTAELLRLNREAAELLAKAGA